MSTPSNSSSGTPRSLTPDMAPKTVKSSTKKSKSAKVRRRIRTLSDRDSEDSELSTDSPLKPKTYTDSGTVSKQRDLVFIIWGCVIYCRYS